MEEKLLELLSARRGHFVLESAHHGNLWLDLDSLFLRPASLWPSARDLARRLSAHRVEAVVGPLIGGAFVAEMIAAELDLYFAFAERRVDAGGATYTIPDAFHDHLRGRTVAIVDDAINAGSATKATFAALTALSRRTTSRSKASRVLPTSCGSRPPARFARQACRSVTRRSEGESGRLLKRRRGLEHRLLVEGAADDL